jgi:hypothetical protein
MPVAALQNVRAGAINRRGAMEDSERAVEANHSQIISRRAEKAVVPRKLDGRAEAYLRILENCNELVSPDRPFPSAETMLQFSNYLDLSVLLLCTRLYMYNVPVAEHVYFNLYDTHIYNLIMKSK